MTAHATRVARGQELPGIGTYPPMVSQPSVSSHRKVPRLDPRLLGIGPGRRGTNPKRRGRDLKPEGWSSNALRGDRDAGDRRVEDEPGKEHEGVEHLVVTEDGRHRVRAAAAVDKCTE